MLLFSLVLLVPYCQFHWSWLSIFQLEAMAYKLILQAELEYNLRGFLPWNYGNKYAKVNVLLPMRETRNFKLSIWLRCLVNIVVN